MHTVPVRPNKNIAGVQKERLPPILLTPSPVPPDLVGQPGKTSNATFIPLRFAASGGHGSHLLEFSVHVVRVQQQQVQISRRKTRGNVERQEN